MGAIQAMPADLRQTLSSMGTQFALALPKHVDASRYTRILFTAIQRNPRLYECTRESLLAACMRAAEQGLAPDGRQGALVPHKGRGGLEAQWFPQWQGLMDLARQSGQILDGYCASVRANDEFYWEAGFHRDLVHRPARGDRGNIEYVYAVLLLPHDVQTFGPGPMSTEEVNAVRARSRARDNGPWVTDWEAMAWKTVLKRALKYVPQSVELQGAIEHDNAEYVVETETKPRRANESRETEYKAQIESLDDKLAKELDEQAKAEEG